MISIYSTVCEIFKKNIKILINIHTELIQNLDTIRHGLT